MATLFTCTSFYVDTTWISYCHGRDRSNVLCLQFTMSHDGSGGEARSSSALREHIDQLTREAFELRRGLTQQVWLSSGAE